MEIYEDKGEYVLMTEKEYYNRPTRVYNKFSIINSPRDDLYESMTCNQCSPKLNGKYIDESNLTLVKMKDLEKHFDEHEGIFTDGYWVWTKENKIK